MVALCPRTGRSVWASSVVMPRGVHGRRPNSRRAVPDVLGWKPSTSLARVDAVDQAGARRECPAGQLHRDAVRRIGVQPVDQRQQFGLGRAFRAGRNQTRIPTLSMTRRLCGPALQAGSPPPAPLPSPGREPPTQPRTRFRVDAGLGVIVRAVNACRRGCVRTLRGVIGGTRRYRRSVQPVPQVAVGACPAATARAHSGSAARDFESRPRSSRSTAGRRRRDRRLAPAFAPGRVAGFRVRAQLHSAPTSRRFELHRPGFEGQRTSVARTGAARQVPRQAVSGLTGTSRMVTPCSTIAADQAEHARLHRHHDVAMHVQRRQDRRARETADNPLNRAEGRVGTHVSTAGSPTVAGTRPIGEAVRAGAAAGRHRRRSRNGSADGSGRASRLRTITHDTNAADHGWSITNARHCGESPPPPPT